MRITRHSFRSACAIWCMAMGLATSVAAQERPKVGLVLGGGGARGAAHIGVLEELERLRVPVDCVAGTSMGALVAGAWMAGRDAASLRREMAQADWNDLFQDNPGYNDVAYRNKRFDKRFLSGSEVGVTAQGLVTPPGVVLGQKIKLFFNQLVGADAEERLIESLPTPLSIVATDIGNGERVVLRDGSLSMAMRASMAVPGLMAPLEYRGRKLVDGGLVDNLPIQEVRDRCGAEVVIAVNVGSPMLPANEVSGLLTVSTQVISILTEQNVSRSLAALRPNDIYIKPDLTGITAAQFERANETADRGGDAARRAVALQRLAVSNADFQAWRQVHAMRVAAPPTVDAIEITGLRVVNPAAVSRHIHQELGKPLDTAQLQQDLLRVYGDGDFERVDYRITTAQRHTTLHVDAVEKPWGPDYARLGVNLNTTLTGRSTYSLRGAYQKAWINPLGGELLFTAELGTHTGLGTEWYQPLEATQQYFGFAAATLRRENLALFANDLRISDYRTSLVRLDAALGRNLGLTGQLRLGLRSERQSLAIETGLPILPTDPVQTTGALLSWESDQKNQLHIATTGWSGKASWYADLQGRYDLLSAQLDGAWALGAWVLGSRASYVGSAYGVPPVHSLERLGGFLNLSGFANDQLMGNRVAYGHVRAERILGRMPIGLSGDLRVGLALEVGKVADPLSEPDRVGLLNSLAIYLRGETPFGPAYVALGRSSTGQTNAYLFIGTP